MDRKLPDSFDYGAHSFVWMAKVLTTYLPRQDLNRGVLALLNYLVYAPEEDEGSPIDVFVQMATTGTYIPTREHVCLDGEECPVSDWRDPLKEVRTAWTDLVDTAETEVFAQAWNNLMTDLATDPDAVLDSDTPPEEGEKE